MPENTGAAEAQGAEATQPQGGAAQAQGAEAQQAEAASATESGAEDVASLRKKLSDFERDNAKYRDRIRTYEQAQRERDDAEKSELQKAQERIAELERMRTSLETERQEARVREAINGTATRLGFQDPTDAYARVMLNPTALEYDDTGKPKNVDAVLTDILNDNPHLGGRRFGSPDAGVRGVGRSQPMDMNAILRRSAGRTS